MSLYGVRKVVPCKAQRQVILGEITYLPGSNLVMDGSIKTSDTPYTGQIKPQTLQNMLSLQYLLCSAVKSIVLLSRLNIVAKFLLFIYFLVLEKIGLRGNVTLLLKQQREAEEWREGTRKYISLCHTSYLLIPLSNFINSFING